MAQIGITATVKMTGTATVTFALLFMSELLDTVVGVVLIVFAGLCHTEWQQLCDLLNSETNPNT